ncbi:MULTISPECIES: hypothetical protein [Pseudomonas]|uniref:hypothetical protein n=1 Tax=Pseudomonas TaxID=286 RepID=UPI000A77CFD8|nr:MULTISPECIES: hypothetical protein [Pseudomonas]AZD01828.1 hypothetical protein C4K27_2634 [Pseudomonas chlororaphis subsp. chlororaphis]MBM0283017.1 hypothetical protein [Pseudomonas chlororaphis]MCP1479324.1 hypothetical protein [Pseudomonas chlororaphis]MCP1594324.1 hypothetical protein [Pseudomonas chlororaphis]MDO1507254.1 hypothetical protein [Pseudomonas chlororaphis]
MWINTPKSNAGRLCVIGGTGQVGQSLMSLLGSCENWEVVFYVESHEQACRLECSFQDHLAQNWKISFDRASIANSHTVLFIAGTKTAAQGSKNDLFADNKKIIDRYLELMRGKNIILVTNPCTRLGWYVESTIDAFTIGVGVQNDYNRLSYQKPDIDYIFGAHNIQEQVFYDVREECVFDGFSNAQLYRYHRETQDKYVSAQLFDLLREELSQDEYFKWWKMQRYHSIANLSSYSCARAIVQTLDYIGGARATKIHGEVRVRLASGDSVFVGVPICNDQLYCTSRSLESFLKAKDEYFEKYRLA